MGKSTYSVSRAGRFGDVIRNYIRRQEALNRRIGQLGVIGQGSSHSAYGKVYQINLFVALCRSCTVP